MEPTEENIDFQQYWLILKRRWFPALAVFGSVVTLTALYTFLKPPNYSSQGQLRFKEDQTSSLIGLESQVKGPSQSDTLLATEAQVITSPSLLLQTLDSINQLNRQGPHLDLGKLQQGLKIKNLEKTDILEISYTSKDPRLPALVVNQLMRVYVDNNLLSNRAAAISARRFITAQLPEVKGNVFSADAALRSFKEKYRITDLVQTETSVAQNINNLRSQLGTLEIQLVALNSRSTAIQKKLGMNSQQAIAVSSLSQSPTVQGVLADLQDVQRKLADARSRFHESHPIITTLEDRQVQLKTLLQADIAQVLQGQKIGANAKFQVGPTQQELMNDLIRLEMNRIGLVSEITPLSKQQAFYEQQSASLPRLEQQQRELQRELLAAQSTYESLLKSLQEVKVTENETVANVRIIEAAQSPAAAADSNKASAMAAGTLAGILLAAGVVYLLEVADKKIRTVKEVRKLFEYRLLGTIPLFSKTTSAVNSNDQTFEQRRMLLPVVKSPRSSISENYRMIQANLKTLNSDKTLKVVVVTSSVPKEGKSTTCANLAAAMAQLGQSVLIIDADLRNPTQHLFWEISNTVGLSNVLSEEPNLDRSIIQRVMENLDVLPTGILPPNPCVLIDSRRMVTFLEKCSNYYNYVFIDTPPLTVAAEAQILGKMADGVVLVTRPGVLDATSSKFAKEYLDQCDQNILGIVVNGVLPENEPDGRYYHTHVNPEQKKNWLDNLKFIKRA